MEGLVHGGAYFRNFTVFRGDRTAVQCMKTETNCPLKGSGGGTLGISGWGCAAGTLEPLTITRAS